MAQNTYKSDTFKKPEKGKKGKASKSKSSFSFFKDPRLSLAFGFVLLMSAIYLFVAFVSYLFTGKADHSIVEGIQQSGIIDSGLETKNIRRMIIRVVWMNM